jgi:hypothetical protein
MRFILYGALFVVALYALIDCISTPGRSIRSLPKAVWLIVIIVVPGLGGLAWLLFGRAQSSGSSFLPGRSQPSAPDDDPEFLRQLGDQTWSQKMKRKRDRNDSSPDEPPAGPAPAAG